MLTLFRRLLLVILSALFGMANVSAASDHMVYLPMITQSLQGCMAANAALAPTSPFTDVATSLLNGDFEQGANNWSEFRSYRRQLIRADDLPLVPFSGRYVAELGGEDMHISAIAQRLRVPQRSNDLTFRYQVRAPAGSPAGIGEIQINGVIVRTFDLSPDAQVTDWSSVSLDIAQYDKQRITLCIQATLEPSSSAAWYLDDLTIP